MQLQEITQRDDSVFPSGIALKNQITTGILTLMQSRHRTLHPHGGPWGVLPQPSLTPSPLQTTTLLSVRSCQ